MARDLVADLRLLHLKRWIMCHISDSNIQRLFQFSLNEKRTLGQMPAAEIEMLERTRFNADWMITDTALITIVTFCKVIKKAS